MSLQQAGRENKGTVSMKKVIVMILVMFLFLPSLTGTAAGGNVIYSGNAGEFIFLPGSEYSPTDLFPNFKEVMPGDRLTQKITVKNLADNSVDTEILLRCLGADEDSKEFLSQLKMYVRQGDNALFGDTTEKAFALDKPVSLGMFHSLESADIEVILEIPTELDNRYASQIGKVKWEFSVREFRHDQKSNDTGQSDTSKDSSGQKEPVPTGDNTPLVIYLLIWTGMLSLTAVLWRKNSDRE